MHNFFQKSWVGCISYFILNFTCMGPLEYISNKTFRTASNAFELQFTARYLGQLQLQLQVTRQLNFLTIE